MNLGIWDESGINECIWDNEETHAGGRGEGKGGGEGGGGGGEGGGGGKDEDSSKIVIEA